MIGRAALAGLLLSGGAGAKDLQELFASQEELVRKTDEVAALTPEERVAREVAEETSSVRHSSIASTEKAASSKPSPTISHLKASVDKKADMQEATHFKLEVPKGETHPKASVDRTADAAEALHVKFAVSPAASAPAAPKQTNRSVAPEPVARKNKTSVAPAKVASPELQHGLPKLQVIMSNSSSFEAAGHLLAGAVPKQVTHFMAKADGPNVVAPDECSCEFRGLCTCEAAVEFMDCISARCTSGNCDCTELQFQHACVSIASTCAVDPANGVMGIEMACSPDRATCLVERDSEMYSKRCPDLIYEELRELKDKKCRLEMHADGGWLNAQRQLTSVNLEIDHRMEELVNQNASLPEMHCEKHFEEWHEDHLNKPEEGPYRSGAAETMTALRLAAPLCLVAAIVGAVRP